MLDQRYPIHRRDQMFGLPLIVLILCLPAYKCTEILFNHILCYYIFQDENILRIGTVILKDIQKYINF